MVTPIQTRYAGHRFRSRLEARWAVFLDHLGAEWLYEPEGYSLPSGWYLPDFLIHPHTEFAFWLEIKPVLPDADGREAAALMDLANATDTHAFMYCRQPGSPIPLNADWAAEYGRRYYMDSRKRPAPDPDLDDSHWWWDSGLTHTGLWAYPGNPRAFSGDIWWTECPLCKRVVLTNNGNITGCPAPEASPLDPRRYTYGADMLPRITAPRLLAAYAAARSARFEHGESGA